ncbi:serine/threonine-protein kinase [Streptomyces fagopyri]|uniref:serine/threonine protein kinase n=1 Tax=Streptomyces fagopyri TaxID=2662397 RepID=UPI003F4D01CA
MLRGAPKLSLLLRHAQEPPRPVRSLRPDISQALDALVLALLDKDPARRPASAEAVSKALAELNLVPTPAGIRSPNASLSQANGSTRPSLPRNTDPNTARVLRTGFLLRGRYKLLEEVAHRGPGCTWNARDQSLARQITVRLLDKTTSEHLDPARFTREATIGARLEHPGLPAVHETEWEGEHAVTVGDSLDSEDLQSVLTRSIGGLSLGPALQLSRSLVETLRVAQDSVAHLGLTWKNVQRRPAGRIVVYDLGTTCTKPGDVGSGLFVAPEQWIGARADARADLYALGCLLYALFTARPPFRGSGREDLAHNHLTQQASPLREIRPAVPPAWEMLTSHLLAKAPGERPRVSEAQAILTRLIDDTPSHTQDAVSVRVPARAEEPKSPSVKEGHFFAPEQAETGTQYRAAGSAWSKGYHTGVDFPVPSGTSVRAVVTSQVISAGWAGSFGYQVILRHPDGLHSQYAHLSALSVRSGQTVQGGQRVGRSGSTGNSAGPHLHFEIRTNPSFGSDIDPVAYLRARGVPLLP